MQVNLKLPSDLNGSVVICPGVCLQEFLQDFDL